LTSVSNTSSTPTSSQRRLQDVEQALPADAAEAVAARDELGAADGDLDVVPVVEGVEDLRRARRVGRLQVAERLVGEDDAPAEGVVGLVALDDADAVRRVLLLHQQREVEAGGPPPMQTMFTSA
jgi:hypothetical protein